MKPTILLAAEDDAVRAFLADNLAADGYEVTAVSSMLGAIAKMAPPDLIVGDLNGDTLAFIDQLAGHPTGAGVPVIACTEQDELAVVRLLDHGADDVVRKPFHYGELLARVRARCRKLHERRVQTLGALTIDREALAVRVDGRPVVVARKEWELLDHLARDPERPFTKDVLLRDVWGYLAPAKTRTVDATACRLRRSLDPDAHRWVHNVRGIGYRLCLPEAS